jgi:hypothetical protein
MSDTTAASAPQSTPIGRPETFATGGTEPSVTGASRRIATGSPVESSIGGPDPFIGGGSNRVRAERFGVSTDSRRWLIGSRRYPTMAEAERNRPANYAEPITPPFAPPADANEPRQRTQSFQDFADEFSERLQAAASELGLLQER